MEIFCKITENLFTSEKYLIANGALSQNKNKYSEMNDVVLFLMLLTIRLCTKECSQ